MHQSVFIMGLLALLWGGSFFFHEILLQHYQVLTVVWMRVTVGALCLLFAAKVFRQPLDVKKNWKHYAILGLLANAAPFSLIVFAQQGISSGLASILNSSVPIFSLLLCWFWGIENLSWRKGVGLALGIAGVMSITGWTALEGSVSLIFCLASIVAAFSYAMSAVYTRTSSRLPPLLSRSAGMMLAASLYTFPGMLMSDDIGQIPTLGSILSLLVLACGGTALAYILFFWLIDNIGATNTTLVTMLVPIIASVLGVLALNEHFRVWDGLGMLLISLGIVLVSGMSFNALVVRLLCKRKPSSAQHGGEVDKW